MPAKKLKHIDELCEIWADEIQTILERSNIAFPSASTIARVYEGGYLKPGCRCPEVILSKRSSNIDVCYREIKKSWQKVLFKRYFRLEKLSSSEYYRLDKVFEYIDRRIREMNVRRAVNV